MRELLKDHFIGEIAPFAAKLGSLQHIDTKYQRHQETREKPFRKAALQETLYCGGFVPLLKSVITIVNVSWIGPDADGAFSLAPPLETGPAL